MERHWSGPGEFREIVQIGGISVDVATFAENRCVLVLIKPVMNPVISGLSRRLDPHRERALGG